MLIQFTDESDSEDMMSQTQGEYATGMQSSKDTLHVLKLATVLHILNRVLRAYIKSDVTELSLMIPVHRIEQAQHLLHALTKQKAVYLQVICPLLNIFYQMCP